ncbi:hypothetical protein WA538_004158, partial [Blastocystis sp. DL]
YILERVLVHLPNNNIQFCPLHSSYHYTYSTSYLDPHFYTIVYYLMVSTQCMNLSFPVRHGGTLTHNPYCQSHRVIHPSLPMPLLPNHCPCPEKACLDQHLMSPVKSLPD